MLRPRLADQERRHLGDVLDFGEAAQGAAVGDALALRLVEPARHFGVDEAGAMALTVMPRRPTSRASDLVKPTIAALVAP